MLTAFTVLMSGVALAGGREIRATYAADGPAVAAAWAQVLNDDQLLTAVNKRALAEQTEGADPFSALVVDVPVAGRVRIGVMEFGLSGALRVQSVGLTQTDVSLALSPTGTLGEARMWGELEPRLTAAFAAALDGRARSAVDLGDAALARLASGARCGAQTDALVDSPWPEAVGVIDAALGPVHDACRATLVTHMVGTAAHQDAVGAWLLRRYAVTVDSERETLVASMRAMVDPGEAVRDLLAGIDSPTADDPAVLRARQSDILAAAQGADLGQWVVSAHLTRGDRVLEATAMLDATAPVQGWPGRSATPVLVVGCSRGSPVLRVDTGFSPEARSGSELAEVAVRMDESEWVESLAAISDDGDGIDVDRGVLTSAGLAAGRVFSVRFTPFRSDPVMARFTLAGVVDALGVVAPACDRGGP